MSKLNILCFLILFFIFSGCSLKQKNYSISLKNTDTVISEYDSNENNLNIYIKKDKTETLIFSKKIVWGHWQFSEDEHRFIFWTDEDNIRNYFLVNLNSGKKLKLKIKNNFVVFSKNFDYYVVPEKSEEEFIFNVYNFHSQNNEKSITWKLKNKDYIYDSEYTLSAASCNYDGCDFEAFVGTDGTCCAIGIFNVNMDTVKSLYEYKNDDDDSISENIERNINKKIVDRIKR